MKVLVTGGSGFIGGHVVQELERRKYCVDIFDLVSPSYYTNANFIQGNITEPLPMIATEYVAVFHCAGLLGTSELFNRVIEAERVNVLGTLNVLDWACHNSDIADDIYVIQPNLLGDWLNPYMQTKQQAERYGMMYHEQHGLKYLSIVPTDVYGPRQHWSQRKAAPLFMIQAILGEPLSVHGDGNSWVNYVFVRDVARFMIDAYETGVYGKRIPLSSPEDDMGVGEFAGLVIAVAESKSVIEYVPMRKGQPGDIEKIEHSLESAMKIMDLATLTPLETGLKESIAWYRGILGRC